MTLVSECSESELIRRYQEVLPVGERTMIGIGDDCAQIATPEGSFVVSTDVIVEDQHFHRYWSDAYQIGARITAQNLADIAGMGGYTSSIVISVVLTPDTEVEWLIDLVRGIGDRAREVGAGVVGGDMSAGEKMVLSMTVMGWCEGDPVVRSGAKPGDVIAVRICCWASTLTLQFVTTSQWGSWLKPSTCIALLSHRWRLDQLLRAPVPTQ